MAIKRRVIAESMSQSTPAPRAATPVTQPVAQQRATRPAPVQAAPDIDAVLTEPTVSTGDVVTVTSNKHRRLKNGVEKISRIKRDMSPEDRDHIIRWWNREQRLVPKEDPVCATIAEQLVSGGQPLSSMQVAGYFSYLCRMGLWSLAEREARFQRTKTRGHITIIPQYSPGLVALIQINWEREREDERIRTEAHREMRAAKAQGKQVRVRTTMQADTLTLRLPHTTIPDIEGLPVRVPVQEEEENYTFTF
jgi:hypothetical protein